MGITSENRTRLLILTSTFPRWQKETEPGFVHELSRRLTDQFDVRVVGPHAPGPLRCETMDEVEIRRFRYAPVLLQTLVNDGGIITNFKRQPWKWLLVPNFILGLFWSTWREIRRWRPDVVHARWLIPQGLVMALFSVLSSRAPTYVVTFHGADLFALRAWPLPALKRGHVSASVSSPRERTKRSTCLLAHIHPTVLSDVSLRRGSWFANSRPGTSTSDLRFDIKYRKLSQFGASS